MNIHIKVFSFIYKIAFCIRNGIWLKGSLYRSRIKGVSTNALRIDGDYINSQIEYRGNGNSVNLHGNIYDCSIKIDGCENKIIIEKGCIIRCKEIWVRGSNCEIVINENTKIMGYSVFVCQGSHNYIHIGKDCLFSTNVQIWNSDTHTILNSDGEVLNSCKPIVIKDHVWLGQNVSVLKGVSIGECSIVGMSSVVTKPIQKHSVAVGNPAKRIGECDNWNIDYVMKTSTDLFDKE